MPQKSPTKKTQHSPLTTSTTSTTAAPKTQPSTTTPMTVPPTSAPSTITSPTTTTSPKPFSFSSPPPASSSAKPSKPFSFTSPPSSSKPGKPFSFSSPSSLVSSSLSSSSASSSSSSSPTVINQRDCFTIVKHSHGFGSKEAEASNNKNFPQNLIILNHEVMNQMSVLPSEPLLIQSLDASSDINSDFNHQTSPSLFTLVRAIPFSKVSQRECRLELFGFNDSHSFGVGKNLRIHRLSANSSPLASSSPLSPSLLLAARITITFQFSHPNHSHEMNTELTAGGRAYITQNLKTNNRLFLTGLKMQVKVLGITVFLSVVGIVGRSEDRSEDKQLQIQVYSVDSDSTVELVSERSWKPQPSSATSTSTTTTLTLSPSSPPSSNQCQIGGLNKELTSVMEMVYLPLLQPETFTRSGVRPPKGVLLYGPPGTGKTLIVKHIASLAFAKMISVSGPSIISTYVGESEENLRRVFTEAHAAQPAIIFFDEIDAICPSRDAGDEMQRRVVATLLTLMDGISSSGRIVVIGATNRPNSLDTALRRPGRFDREIEIGIPNEEARVDILTKLLTKTPHTLTSQQITELSNVCHGYVGADLLSLVREAGLACIERSLSSLSSSPSLSLSVIDFQTALPRVQPSAMREVSVSVPKVNWSDVGGQETVKQKLKEAVEWPLKHPQLFARLGITPPKGILLYGPPGCSKTLLAKALANESTRNFLAVKGPELLSKWVGESEKAIAEIFRKARAASPSILFFDEIDSIATRRSQHGEGDRVADRILTQLLVELDGVEPLDQVTVLAATNRPDILDDALVRAGRIDRMLYVGPPDKPSAVEILKIELSKVPHQDNVDYSMLADACEGLSGAEIGAAIRQVAMDTIQNDLQATHVSTEKLIEGLSGQSRGINKGMLEYYTSFAASRAHAVI